MSQVTLALDFLKAKIENRGGKARGFTEGGRLSYKLDGVNYRLDMEDASRMIAKLPDYMREAMQGKRKVR